MAKKKKLKKMSAAAVTVFKIANRKGYAAVADNFLTEGNTPLQAYTRMIKACKRNGLELPEKKASQLKVRK